MLKRLWDKEPILAMLVEVVAMLAFLFFVVAVH